VTWVEAEARMRKRSAYRDLDPGECKTLFMAHMAELRARAEARRVAKDKAKKAAQAAQAADEAGGGETGGDEGAEPEQSNGAKRPRPETVAVPTDADSGADIDSNARHAGSDMAVPFSAGTRGTTSDEVAPKSKKARTENEAESSTVKGKVDDEDEEEGEL